MCASHLDRDLTTTLVDESTHPYSWSVRRALATALVLLLASGLTTTAVRSGQDLAGRPSPTTAQVWKWQLAQLGSSASASGPDANTQRALVTVADAWGVKDEPIALPLQVQATKGEGTLLSVYLGDVPKGARLKDGTHEAVAAKAQDLIDITAWKLDKITFAMPSGITGTFELSLVVLSETGARPLLTQASFSVHIKSDRASLPAGPARTVQADVKPDQIEVRTKQVGNPTEPAAAETGSITAAQDGATSARAALRPAQPAATDPVAQALAADRKSSLERERTRTDALTRELTEAREQIGELKSQISPLPPPQSPAGREMSTVELNDLLVKAKELVGRGDISGARLVLERALETGSLEAAFYLGQTYDRRFLQSWNVHGISPDPEKARELYGRALKAGLKNMKALAQSSR
jgi:hypothetical protein